MHANETRLLTLIEQELGLPPGSVSHETRLPDLGDSLDWLSLMSAVEDAYGIEISEAQSLGLATFGDLLRLVEEPLAA